MKYFLLLCFLLVLVNSKVPNKSFKSFLEDSKISGLEDPCAQSKDVCLAKILDDENTQCCYVKMEGEEEECARSPKPLSIFSNIINTKQFKPFSKEIFGYINNGMDEEKKIDIPEIHAHAKCSDGELDINFGGEKYTEEEIKILKSPDHCMNYTVSSIYNFYTEPKEYDCTKGQLLQSSKDAGIECGNLNIQVKAGNQDINFKSCMPFSFDMFSKITIPSMYNQQIGQGAAGMLGGNITVELSDSKGRKFTYDSGTGKIMLVNNENNGGFITISKYLFLLSLFLF